MSVANDFLILVSRNLYILYRCWILVIYTTDHPDYDSYGCVYNLPTSIKDIETPGGKCQKLLRDGHLYILRDNKLYDVLGTPMN